MLPIMNNEQLHIVLKPVKMRSMWQTIVGPVRSNEWGRAVWLLQRQYLETGRGLDWRYIAFHDQQDDDVVSVESMRAYMHGQIMKVNASFTCWETVSQFQPWFFPVGHFFGIKVRLRSIGTNLQLLALLPARESSLMKVLQLWKLWHVMAKLWSNSSADNIVFWPFRGNLGGLVINLFQSVVMKKWDEVASGSENCIGACWERDWKVPGGVQYDQQLQTPGRLFKVYPAKCCRIGVS